jgi:hypothetical protein
VIYMGPLGRRNSETLIKYFDVRQFDGDDHADVDKLVTVGGVLIEFATVADEAMYGRRI